MSYRLYQVQQKPVAAWVLDGTSPFPEHSGSGATATASGTLTSAAPLVACAGYSTLFHNAFLGVFSNSLFRQGRESRVFALEAWVYPAAPVAKQQILSRTGLYDGLWIQNNVVHFSTTYTSTGTADCSFDLGTVRAFHVVGVHTPNQNQLWVDGVMVDTIDITTDQKADTFSTATNTNLTSGTSTDVNSRIALNGVAMYNSITPEGIKRNFNAGRDVMPQANVPSQFRGIPIFLDANNGAVYFDRSFKVRDEFLQGYGNNVVIQDEYVSPAPDVNNLSVASSWSAAFPLDTLNVSNIYGVFVEWTALNVTVEARVDTGSWTTLTNRALISTIGPNFTSTGKLLEVRVNFPAGVVQGGSFLESLNVVGFQTNSFDSSELRVINVTYPGAPRKDFEPIEYREDNGVSVSGGTLTIGPDTSEDPVLMRTLELWVKPLDASYSVSVNGGSFTTYRNGVLWANGVPPVGQWSLVHYVGSADFSGNITVAGNVIVGQAALYPSALTATQVDVLWKSYTGRPVVSFADTGTIAIVEDATPFKTFLKDWAVESG